MKAYLSVLVTGLLLLGCTSPAPVTVVDSEKTITEEFPKIPKFKLPERVKISDEPFQGEAQAAITLVVFSDYQCPYCAHFANNTLPLLEQEYIAKGQLKLVFRDLPYLQGHPYAKSAAVAVHCAGEQNKFWPMHNILFADQNRLKMEDLSRNAKLLALDVAVFQSCMNSGRHDEAINEDLEEAKQLSIQATPTFFFGFTPEDGQALSVKGMMTGSQPHETFQRFIDALLKKAASEQMPPT